LPLNGNTFFTCICSFLVRSCTDGHFEKEREVVGTNNLEWARRQQQDRQCLPLTCNWRELKRCARRVICKSVCCIVDKRLWEIVRNPDTFFLLCIGSCSG
jgi:hypothetical protein